MTLKNTHTELITIRDSLLNALNIGIITHSNPDGDAMGSSMAMYLTLKKQGKNVRMITPNAYPEFLQWIKGNQEVIVGDKDKPETLSALNDCDVLIMQDFNVLSRTDWMEEHIKNMPGKKVLIDHHPNPGSVCESIISEPEMSSTSELLYHIFKVWGWDKLVDRDIAEAIYCGILTDTGCFSFNSSDPATFGVIADLLRKGIRKDKVYSLVYNNYSEDRMRLLGLALKDRMKLFPDYNAAYIALTREDLKRFNFRPGDTEGFVNYPLSIRNTRFTALFLEKEDHIKISFRSTGDFPANAFSANHFNGGGHLNAAGGNSSLNLQESLKKFVSLLPEYKKLLTK